MAALFTSKGCLHTIDLCVPIHNMHLYHYGGIDNTGPKASEKIEGLMNHGGDTKHWHLAEEEWWKLWPGNVYCVALNEKT